MAGEPRVFICHSSQDAAAARLVCDELERSGVKCWIAPRNIAPGTAWGDAIIRGIEASAAMVVVLTKHSAASTQVAREVDRAVSKGVRVIPLRLDAAALSGAMEYLLCTAQWLDASSGSLEDHVPALVKTLAFGTAAFRNARPAAPRKGLIAWARRRRRWLWGAGVAVAAALLVTALVAAWPETGFRAAGNSLPATTVSAPASTAAGAPAMNMAGEWLLEAEITEGSGPGLRSDRAGYRVVLTQNGERIEGRGVRWSEDGREVPAKARTKVVITGTLVYPKLVLNYSENRPKHDLHGQFMFTFSGTDKASGGMTALKRDVTGKASLSRLH